MLCTCSETNLKVRQPLPETAVLEDIPDKLCNFDGELQLLGDLLEIRVVMESSFFDRFFFFRQG